MIKQTTIKIRPIVYTDSSNCSMNQPSLSFSSHQSKLLNTLQGRVLFPRTGHAQIRNTEHKNEGKGKEKRQKRIKNKGNCLLNTITLVFDSILQVTPFSL
jgi:hypothetical protein